MTTIAPTRPSTALNSYRHVWTAPTDGETRSLVLLHGTGGDALSFDAFGAALAPGLGRLSIQGDVLEGGAARFFRRRAEGVYDMADLAFRTDQLDRFLEEAFEAYGLMAEETIAVGYSNGANILANLAFVRPDRLRRLALLRPLIPYAPPAAIMSGVEALVAAGRRDPIAPAPLNEALAQALRARGACVTEAWSPGGHGLEHADLDAVRRFIA